MSDPLPPDPYKALGLQKDATTDAVKKAYRKLVLTCHPDKTKALPETQRKEKEEQFHRVREAHELLSNDDSRQRYDLQVIRDALLAEKRAQQGSARSSSYAQQAPPRPTTTKSTSSPIYETHRGPPKYETRVPKNASYDDDPRYESRRGPVHSQSYQEPYYDAPRRSSGRTAGDRVRDRDREDDERAREKIRLAASKLEEARRNAERQRQRDKAQKQERQSKQYASRTTVASDSESDSVDQFMSSSKRSPEPKKRYAEVRKPSRTDDRGRRSRSEESDYSEDDRRVTMKMKEALAHIKKHKPSEKESRDARPSQVRSGTSKAVPPTPPLPPPAPTVDSIGKRPSSRRTPTLSKAPSGKERKLPDIVDPPPSRRTRDYDDDYDDRDYDVVKPSLSSRNTSRATTFNDKVASEKTPAPLRRAQTQPAIPASRETTKPSRSSRLKHTEVQEPDYRSRSSSDEAPAAKVTTATRPSFATTTTKSYRYIEPSDDEGPSRARIVEVSPDRSRSRRDDSPRTSSRRYPSERLPSANPLSHRAAPSRAPPARSQTYVDSTSAPSPRRTTSHQASGSGDRPLFGELTGDTRKHSYADVQFSPKLEKDNIRYSDAPYGRRGSADVRMTSKEKEACAHIDVTGGRGGGGRSMGGRQASYVTAERAH